VRLAAKKVIRWARIYVGPCLREAFPQEGGSAFSMFSREQLLGPWAARLAARETGFRVRRLCNALLSAWRSIWTATIESCRCFLVTAQ
jgi:hypothetical protein